MNFIQKFILMIQRYLNFKLQIILKEAEIYY